MIKRLISTLKQRKILILGFGREGRSTYQFIRQHLPTQPLTVADQRTDFWQIDDPYTTVVAGPQYLDGLEAYDLIIKAPGISLAKIDTTSFRAKITSQLELFLECFDLPVIGVTGTKGKSTTSSLIYQILQDQQVPSLLLGNIGAPVFEHLTELNPDQTIVLEMSSHQLEFMRRSPHIALLLNAYEEHLDHYASFADYVEAKCQIFRHQSSQDYLIYNFDNQVLREFVQNPVAQTYRISLAHRDGSDVYLQDGEVFFRQTPIYAAESPRQLLGDYNLQNIMFALTVAELLGLDLARAQQTIAEFKTLRHRLELVSEHNGVRYYDNSIGTVPMATMAAMQALRDVDTLIIGGMDRGLDYTEFAQFLNQDAVRHVICTPVTGHQIAEKLLPEKVQLVEDLAEAVQRASELTAPGKICLLSPTAASYGAFKNFEEKGDLFQKLVHELA